MVERYFYNYKYLIMYKNKKIAIVVPAYNEEKLIGRVISTLPDFVDKIIVVNDLSTDGTEDVVNKLIKVNDKLLLINHETNQGVGGAIVTGYKMSLKLEYDVTVVMAGDAQMDPEELTKIIDPVVDNKTDYVKGNRFFYEKTWQIMPKYRFLGNSVLSMLTKIATGYWHISDSQSGYTAISLKVLDTINLDQLYKKYGFPNDILVSLNICNFRVRDIPIKPIYNIGEKSGIKLRKVIPKITFLLFRGFMRRMIVKYIVRDFHPLIFFYFSGILFLTFGTILGGGILIKNSRIFGFTSLPLGYIILSAMLVISGFQFLLFAMWFDHDYNRDLNKIQHF